MRQLVCEGICQKLFDELEAQNIPPIELEHYVRLIIQAIQETERGADTVPNRKIDELNARIERVERDMLKSDNAEFQTNVTRIGVILVHGVGEQK